MEKTPQSHETQLLTDDLAARLNRELGQAAIEEFQFTIELRPNPNDDVMIENPRITTGYN